jgi:hypothetical protein
MKTINYFSQNSFAIGQRYKFCNAACISKFKSFKNCRLSHSSAFTMVVFKFQLAMLYVLTAINRSKIFTNLQERAPVSRQIRFNIVLVYCLSVKNEQKKPFRVHILVGIMNFCQTQINDESIVDFRSLKGFSSTVF